MESTSRMDILKGNFETKDLPPIESRDIRVFLSSSSSDLDMKAERTAIMERVRPKLRQICRETYGIDFQMVDLKWNMPEHLIGEVSMAEFAEYEIKKCQEYSIGPNFVVLLGQKYGSSDLPAAVTARMFIELENTLKNDSATLDLLEHCYFLDQNKTPPQYILRSRKEILDSMSFVTQRYSDWTSICNHLSQSLKEAAQQCLIAGNLTAEECLPFSKSELERQITLGLLHSTPKPDGCGNFIIHRSITDISENLNDTSVSDFIDILDNASIDENSDKKMASIVENMKSKLNDDIISFSISWSMSGANVDPDAEIMVRKKSILPDHLAARVKADRIDKEVDVDVFNHREYINDFCNKFEEQMLKRIHKCLLFYQPRTDELENEIIRHLRAGLESQEVSVLQTEAMEKLVEYCQSKEQTPLFVVGESGAGKSTLLANAIASISGPHSVVVYRKFGLTETTSTIQCTLIDICQQLTSIMERNWKAPLDYYTLVMEFREMLIEMSSKASPLVLLLDDIEELTNDHNPGAFKWLPDVLPENVKVVISVCTAEARWGTKMLVLERFQAKEATFTMLEWLASNQLKLSDQQHQYARLAVQNPTGVTPLFLKLLCEDLHQYHSYNNVNILNNVFSVQSLVERRLHRLETTYSHIFVKHLISFIAAAKQGVSEYELEGLMHMDGRLIEYLRENGIISGKDIPPVMIFGLIKHLGDLLKINNLSGKRLWILSHKSIKDACQNHYSRDAELKVYIHSLMADYFIGYAINPSQDFVAKFRYGCPPSQPYERTVTDPLENKLHMFNTRKVVELPHHLEMSRRHNELCTFVIYNYEYLRARLFTDSVQGLLLEYNAFTKHPVLGDNTDITLLSTTLRHIAKSIRKSPESLNVELCGRLSDMIGTSPHFAMLITQCDLIGGRHCPLIPTFPVFGAMQPGVLTSIDYAPNMSLYDTERGLVTCTKDLGRVITKEASLNEVSFWETSVGEKQRVVQLPNGTDQKTYREIKLCPNDNYIVCTFHDPTFGFEVFDFISGKLTASYQDVDDLGFHEICYITTNYLAVVSESSESRLFRLTTGEILTKAKGISLPHALTPDEKYLIGLKYGKLTIYCVDTGMKMCVIRDADAAAKICINQTSRRTIVGLHTGEIHVYNTGIISPGFPLVPIASFPPNDISEEHQYMLTLLRNRLMKVTKMVLSPDNLYILADYDTARGRKAFVWDIKAVELMSELTSGPEGDVSEFTRDSALVMRYSPNDVDCGQFYVYRVATGNLLLVCDIKHQIYNITASSVSNLVTVATQNRVYVLDIQTLRAKHSPRGRNRIVLEGQKSPTSFKHPRYPEGSNVIYSSGNTDGKFIYFDMVKNKFVTTKLKIGRISGRQKPTTRTVTSDGEKLLMMYEESDVKAHSKVYNVLINNGTENDSNTKIMDNLNTNVVNDATINEHEIKDTNNNTEIIEEGKPVDVTGESKPENITEESKTVDTDEEGEPATSENNVDEQETKNADDDSVVDENDQNIGSTEMVFGLTASSNLAKIDSSIFEFVNDIFDDAWREGLFEVRELYLEKQKNAQYCVKFDESREENELSRMIEEDAMGNVTDKSLILSRSNTTLELVPTPRTPAIPRYTRSAPLKPDQNMSPILLGPSTVLRVFSSETGEHLYTIDLKSEKVISYSTDYIFTVWNGARTSKSHVYSMTDGTRVATFYEKVRYVEILPDKRMATISGSSGSILKVYSGKNFGQLSAVYDIREKLGYVTAISITSFPLRPSVILIKYTPENFPNRVRYCLFELKSFAPYIPILNVVGGFKDISKNGRVAIDAYLRVYNLETGDVAQQITTEIETAGGRIMSIQPRFTDDSRYVVWINRSLGTLNVVLNNYNRNIQIAKCPLHTISLKKALSNQSQLYLTNAGRTVIIIDNENFLVFSLVDETDPLREVSLSDPMYGDNSIRGEVLLQPIKMSMMTNSEHFVRQMHISIGDFI